MNLSPQKSKTIHDYRQHHGQADTEQTAPAEPAASPGCSRHQGLELGHPPNKWGLSLWIWGPEGCVVFTVSSHKFLMPPCHVIQLLATGKMRDGEKCGGWGDSERVGSLFPNLCPWIILSLKIWI